LIHLIPELLPVKMIDEATGKKLWISISRKYMALGRARGDDSNREGLKAIYNAFIQFLVFRVVPPPTKWTISS